MRKLLAVAAATAAFSAMAKEESDTEAARQPVAATLVHRAQACPAEHDGDAASGELINAQMHELVADASFKWAYTLVSEGFSACVDSRLRNLMSEDGRPVIASIGLGERQVMLNPKATSDEALDMAGKGVAEALKQIEMRGGARPPAHMLRPLAVVGDAQSSGGFTIIADDARLQKALQPVRRTGPVY